MMIFALTSCSDTGPADPLPRFSGAPGEVKLMTLDPGHFHAALVQKTMYEEVSPVVHVYAPGAEDLELHIERLEAFNGRPENPTRWEWKVYIGPDYLERMLAERPGNVMVTAGNNRRKTECLKKAVDAAIHVLSDKPMCIDTKGFELLKAAFESAERHGVLLYDIMTERYEITSILQKELVARQDVFGELQPGTPENPSVVKESVHHLFKSVAGSPLRRPAWYFDVAQQGEGIVDVSSHLVDLVMWAAFPEQIIDYANDVLMLRARRWPTRVTGEQFERVTGKADFPDYLKPQLDAEGVLPYYCNGEMVYALRGVHTRISVIWNFEAPPGSGDTHFSVMKGSRANVFIRQGSEQRYTPELYIEPASGVDLEALGGALERAVADLQTAYPGIELRQLDGSCQILIPDRYRVGHEAHFGEVTAKFLRFLVEGRLPDWEVPNTIAKYYTTTQALELARRSNH